MSLDLPRHAFALQASRAVAAALGMEHTLTAAHPQLAGEARVPDEGPCEAPALSVRIGREAPSPCTLTF